MDAHFGPTLVNTARVGYNRTVGFVGKPGVALNPLASDTSLSDGFLPGNPAPIITGTGLDNDARDARGSDCK